MVRPNEAELDPAVLYAAASDESLKEALAEPSVSP